MEQVVDKVSMELETIKIIYERIRVLEAHARIRAWKYIESLLAEEP